MFPSSPPPPTSRDSGTPDATRDLHAGEPVAAAAQPTPLKDLVQGLGLFLLAGCLVSLLLGLVTHPIAQGFLTAAGVLTFLVQRLDPLNLYWAALLLALALLAWRVPRRATLVLIGGSLFAAGAANVFGGHLAGWTLLGILQFLLGMMHLAWFRQYAPVARDATAAPQARPEFAPAESGSLPPQERAGKLPPRPGTGVRVFVSSTFHDMHAERDELVKRVFPQLRRLCEERGVAWGEVDLRWGVTDEQAAEGRVLPICLEEIRRCRPYFVGLLGERYGWVPDDIPAELIEREPWLAEHHDHSVTELEILHGVLNDPGMAGQAYFYLRSPAYVDSLPAAERTGYLEETTAEDIERFGVAGAEHRAEERRHKLEALKERIRASGLPVREGYATPEALGELVLQDLTAVIDRLHPVGTQPGALEREASEHEAYTRSRSGVYIGGERYFDRLDAHVQGDGPPLVILGGSGSGKSALLANWALRYREAHCDCLLLPHFCGATPYSADWAAMVRRIMGELGRRMDIEGAIPDRPDALRSAFAKFLSMAAARGRVVLVLDGLDQLEDRDQAPDLAWLPREVPANVRLLVSTLPGRPLDELKRRAWPSLEVQPLAPDERRRLVVDYLAQYGKALSRGRAERVAAAPQSANPLYLRALLEELRLFGVHERLDERIGHYLAAGTVAELYEKVLARYEEDYERDRPGLVGEAMSLLWAARRGLSEAELLELLGRDGQPLPRAHWSPLYLAAEASLVNRSGLLGFFHDYLRRAVQRRYLAADEAQQAAHLRLANYFHGREVGARRVDEEPWQWAEARAWERLRALLTNLPFFYAACQADEFEVRARWAQIEAGSEMRLVDAYRAVLDAPGDHDPDVVWKLGRLLDHTGHPAEALSVCEHLVEHYRTAGNLEGLAGALNNQALALSDQGDWDGALALHKEQERLCRELGDRDRLQMSLGNQARILYDRGDLDAALALLKEQERLCREMGDRRGLRYSLGTQALIQHDRGELESAMALHKEVERMCRELGQKDGLAVALGRQALILRDWGDLEGALALHREEERLCREMGDKDGLSRTLGNQGIILKYRGDLEGAMALHKEEERLCRERRDKSGLQASLGNQANILADRGEPDAAMALYREQEHLCRELGKKRSLAAALGNQGLILRHRGDHAGALALHREQERLSRELGAKDELGHALCNQANVLADQGDLDGAVALYRSVAQLCRELGNKELLARVLTNEAVILGLIWKQSSRALALADEAYRLAAEAGYAPLAEWIKSVRADIRKKVG